MLYLEHTLHHYYVLGYLDHHDSYYGLSKSWEYLQTDKGRGDKSLVAIILSIVLLVLVFPAEHQL